MPFITVQLIEGRSVEQKHALIKEISEAAIRVLDADPDNVRIVINEVTADDWGVGGVPLPRLIKAPTPLT